jgi:transglutaminase-like putative cysteine protease
VALYYWVRDEIRYNPYGVALTPETLAASHTLAVREAWCVPKSVLLAALCRAVGIPARLGFADVRNHLSTERMRQSMDTDVFYFHGYTAIFLEGKWVKATPAFNIELCEKFGLHPLEFDGLEDSLYHEFDRSGNRHMEYLNDRGEYVDIPLDEMLAVFAEHYPDMIADATDWDADVRQEVSRLS